MELNSKFKIKKIRNYFWKKKNKKSKTKKPLGKEGLMPRGSPKYFKKEQPKLSFGRVSR